MNISQKTIELSREAMRKFGKSDCAYQLAEHILREAGELPEEPPQKVRVPDCFHASQWISINSAGIISLHPTKPEYFEDQDVWHDDTGIALYILAGESLRLPDEFTEDSSWEVSELRQMAAEYAEWEVKQSESSKSLSDNWIEYQRNKDSETLPNGWIEHTGDECPVAGDVEVYYRVAKDAEFDETIVDVACNLFWSQDMGKGTITHYKIANPEEPSQMEKDHAAMELLRSGKVHNVVRVLALEEEMYQAASYSDGNVYTEVADNPADAILAAGGK